MSLNADETALATGSEDWLAAIWRVSDGEMLTGEIEHNEKVWSVRFSSDGAWLITSAAQYCRVWETAGGEPVTPFLAHGQLVNDAGFFSEGERLWVQLADQTIVVWPLGRASDSIEQLTATSEALGVGNARLRGQNFPKTANVSDDVLNALRAQSESRLARFTSDLPAWHEREAAACGRETNWFGVCFHLNQLRKYRPADAALRPSLRRGGCASGVPPNVEKQ
jgi:hypothetical protein